MRPENLINTIMGILTFISVLLVWATLLEMKQQRESTYKPVIAVQSENEFVIKQYDENPDFYLMGIDPAAVEGIGYKLYGFTIPYLYFTVENIGMGAARNVICEWPQDIYNRYAEYIKESGTYRDLKLIEDGNLKIISSQDEVIFRTNWPTRFEIPYININEKEDKIKIDAGILGYLIGIGMNVANEMPTLELNISYEDLYGKKYTTFAKINIISTCLKKDDGLEYFVTFEILADY